MRLTGPASVDEMVLAFLRAEADSPRHGKYFVGLDRRLIDGPDLTDPVQNLRRKAALWAYRDVFLDPLPADVSWQRWSMTPAELGDVRYANHGTWLVLSNRTRRIRDGAAGVQSGLAVTQELGVEIAAGIRGCARAVDAGVKMPELIAVAQNPEASSLVLAEGHTRATAYLVARKPPSEVTVLVGWSWSMASWPWL